MVNLWDEQQCTEDGGNYREESIDNCTVILSFHRLISIPRLILLFDRLASHNRIMQSFFSFDFLCRKSSHKRRSVRIILRINHQWSVLHTHLFQILLICIHYCKSGKSSLVESVVLLSSNYYSCVLERKIDLLSPELRNSRDFDESVPVESYRND
jgi:hypothetical protein